MKLLEALQALKKAPADGEPFVVALACGFEPLHLETFLAAHLQRAMPARRVAVRAGLYGDLAGNVARLAHAGAAAAAVAIEWADLDPRLGLRNRGGWDPAGLPHVLESVRMRLSQIEAALSDAALPPVALCLPTLPLPPADCVPGWQAGHLALELHALVAGIAARVARGGVRVVDAQRLAEVSPPAQRLDVRAELRSGFPYALPHASAVAELFARLLCPPAPKKGLITDLDDTLWRGILGEAGVAGVAWDLDHHSQTHALYQQLLHSLAAAGVLLAVASKNDPDLVEQALAREDLLLPRDCLFPVEANWGQKSASVARILRQWNIGADSVVFVDDSPMELAEVKAAHPGVECVLYPTEDDAAAVALLSRLRDLFGKETITEEDGLRLASLRRHAAISDLAFRVSDLNDFLRQAEAELAVDFRKEPSDPRALELVNKTNQFNLNGVRLTEGEWRARLVRPGAFLLVAGYRDKYGPLGKIAAVAGRAEEGVLRIETWVMSCRAFGRRIEHGCLAALFERFGAAEAIFDFQPTPRNGPLQAFLGELLGAPPGPAARLTRERFAQACPPLFHRVREVTHD
ncbi:MAG TPA: HAD-IIIC family phosphatase [Planctomycetota bacterium]|nr:HAD-IIIC family phosphatase [Planctomycetota bacterium]HRR78857.1 HAD-IIIC family phosphatase [Planctomycetota bacterium]HRT92837.1 HAD-IIIC family phosphatase [Planctomycetota bacterium]